MPSPIRVATDPRRHVRREIAPQTWPGAYARRWLDHHLARIEAAQVTAA
jgi:hypothetical protein